MIPANPQDFTLIEEIGKGGFSVVWKAIHNTTEETVAIKITQKNSLNVENESKRYDNEIQIHTKMNHPFICPILGQRQNLINRYIILEYISNGSLATKMDSKEEISEKDAKHYFCQMICAVEYLHSNKICHHDLKPQNILIDSENNIRIIDFGLSVNFEDKEEMNKNYGSPRFAAPELFQGKTHTEKVDIWSLGVILYKLFVGYFPFNKPDLEDLIHQIVNDEVSVPESLDPGLRDLIMGMLDKNQEKRFSIQDIKENSWFKEASSSDETLKQEDFAGTRPSLQDLKSKITIKRIPRISSLKGLRLERTNTLEKLVASGDFKRITSEPVKKHHRNSIPIDLLK